MVQFFLRNKLSILVISLTVLLLGGSYFFLFKETCNGDCKNGFGSKIYWNGKKYIGQWKNNKENGYGVLVAKDQKILYSGKWQEGKQVSKESEIPKKR